MAFRDRFPQVQIPARTHTQLTDGTFLVMSCYDPSERALGMKLITVHNHPANNEARVQATYMLLDANTARPTLIIEAGYLTDIRTAAASAVATRFLARKDARVLGIFGTGRQARAHVAVIPLVRKIDRVLVSGRNPHSAADFAEGFSRPDLPIHCADAATCAGESDIVCTCTTSTAPLFDGHLLQPGTHLNLVGAFQPNTREVDSCTVERARVFVDTFDGAFAEAGDLLIPMSEGTITRDHVLADLHELAAGKKPGRNGNDDITIFKSVGCALEDLVSAEVIQRALSSSTT